MARYGFSLSEWQEQAEQSKNFDSYKVYVLECYNEDERFIKIGRTFTTVAQRYSEVGSLPYKYEILGEVSDNPFRVFRFETKLKRMFKEFKYSPKIKFSGFKESFSIEIKQQILEQIQ